MKLTRESADAGPLLSMVMKAGRDQAAGALCAAHVPRTGLSPGSPPLLRSAQRPADLIGHHRNTSTRSNPVARRGCRVTGVVKSRRRAWPQAKTGGHERSRSPGALGPYGPTATGRKPPLLIRRFMLRATGN